MNAKHRIAHGVNINVDRTTCVTEPTKSTSCFNAHVSPLAISLRNYTLGDFVRRIFLEAHTQSNVFVTAPAQVFATLTALSRSMIAKISSVGMEVK
jgi:hypothetical protein